MTHENKNKHASWPIDFCCQAIHQKALMKVEQRNQYSKTIIICRTRSPLSGTNRRKAIQSETHYNNKTNKTSNREKRAPAQELETRPNAGERVALLSVDVFE